MRHLKFDASGETETSFQRTMSEQFIHRVYPVVLVPQDKQDPSDLQVEMDPLVYEDLREHVVLLVPQDPQVNPDRQETLVLLDYKAREVMMVLTGSLVVLVREGLLVLLDSQAQLALKVKTVVLDPLAQLVKMDGLEI